jgi:hypothetical protein
MKIQEYIPTQRTAIEKATNDVFKLVEHPETKKQVLYNPDTKRIVQRFVINFINNSSVQYKSKNGVVTTLHSGEFFEPNEEDPITKYKIESIHKRFRRI